jgi:hypothetical protein
MLITAEQLQEFIGLYEEEFKDRLSEDEAREVASRLIELYQLLAQPLPSEIAKLRQECSRVEDRERA